MGLDSVCGLELPGELLETTHWGLTSDWLIGCINPPSTGGEATLSSRAFQGSPIFSKSRSPPEQIDDCSYSRRVLPSSSPVVSGVCIWAQVLTLTALLGLVQVQGKREDIAPAPQRPGLTPEAWGLFHGGCLLGICRLEVNLARIPQSWVPRGVSKLLPGLDSLVSEACPGSRPRRCLLPSEQTPHLCVPQHL